MHQFKRIILPSYESNIPRFYVYRALNNFLLFLPVWVIFLQQKHDISLSQVTLIDVAFWMTMVLTEVPTGAFADTLGRKQSIFVGVLLVAISNFGFALAPSFVWVVLANSLWAVAMTFISGANMALFYDTLRELGREKEYPKHRGRLQAIALVSMGVSGALGGVIGEVSLLSTFMITGGLMLLAALIVSSFKEPPREPDADTGKTLTYWQTLKVSSHAIRESSGLRYALLYSALLPMAIAPIRLTFMQPYAIAIGLPIAALGFISVGIRGFQVWGSLQAQNVVERLGEWNWLRLSPMIIFIGIAALGYLNNLAGIGVFAITAFASAASRPLVESLILRQTPGSVRATILSVDSLFGRLAMSALELGMGVMADQQGLASTFTITGWFYGAILLFSMLSWGRVWERPAVADAQTG